MEYAFYLARVQKTLRKEAVTDALSQGERNLVQYGHVSEVGPCDCAYQIVANREDMSLETGAGDHGHYGDA